MCVCVSCAANAKIGCKQTYSHPQRHIKQVHIPGSRQNIIGLCAWTLNLSHLHTLYLRTMGKVMPTRDGVGQ